jgi:flagellar biosynthesis/type III secretory pathway M-ring protein FliF/YscJ
MAVLTKRVSQRATQEPEHVARLIRSWVSDDKG